MAKYSINGGSATWNGSTVSTKTIEVTQTGNACDVTSLVSTTHEYVGGLTDTEVKLTTSGCFAGLATGASEQLIINLPSTEGDITIEGVIVDQSWGGSVDDPEENTITIKVSAN